MNRPTEVDSFTSAGDALTRIAPHLPTTLPSLVSAASMSFREVTWNAAGADALADRSAPHGRRTYRDCALGALERHEEVCRALKAMLLAIPDQPEAA